MGLLSDLFGKRPKVPTLASLEEAQGKAVKQNVASFADIAKLATQVDSFNQQQLEDLADRTLPGGRQKIQEIITSQLRGEIPQDVLRGLRQSQSERSAGALTQGSPFALGSELSQQLGMSLALTNQGLKSAEQWLAASRTPTFDITSMFITPAQKYQDQANQFNRNFLENKIKASPDPGTRGLFDTGMQILGMAMSAYGGGPGYTGTHDPNKAYSGGGEYGGGGNAWNGPGGFYIGGNNWGFGRTQNDEQGNNQWFFGKRPGKG